MIASNTQSGFIKTGIWNPATQSVSIAPLQAVLFPNNNRKNLSFTISSTGTSPKGRSLLFSADVGKTGTIKINTKSGVNLTSAAVLAALFDR